MKKNLLNFAAFIILNLTAVLIFIKDLLPHISVNISGTFFVVLEIVKDVLLFLIISILAYKFVQTKKKGLRIFFVVMLIIFIVGLVLRLV